MLDLSALLLAVIVAAVSVTVISRRWRLWRDVEKIPGYVALPLVGTTYRMFFLKREEFVPEMDMEYERFKPIFRTWLGGMPEISLNKPEHLEKIMSSNEMIEKSPVYSFLQPWLGQGLLTSTGSKWHSHRKMITPAFHFQILDNFIDVFAEKSEVLVEKLKSKADGRPFDIYPNITRCTLDIICETAMGTAINAQNERESPYVSAVYSINALTIRRMISPWLHSDFIFKRSPTGKEYYKQLAILHGFTKEVINKKKVWRQENSSKGRPAEQDDLGRKRRVAFLDLLLDASEDGHKLNDLEIQQEVDTFMFGGHDTTSVAMSWVLILLGHHPEIQERVYNELKDIFQDDPTRHPTMQDLNNMKYLEMVIKETLRLYPSAPIVSRLAHKDIQVGGYKIPAGCMISLNIRRAQRDSDHWPQSERYDPDNFLPERVKGRHPYAYVPFSAGPRNCIGQKFAMIEMKTVLSYTLRNYSVESVDKLQDIKVVSEVVLRPFNGVNLKLTAR